MKVRLKIGRAGIGFSQNAGDAVDVTADEAKRLIDSGQAEPVKKVERAVPKAKAEKAVKR